MAVEKEKTADREQWARAAFTGFLMGAGGDKTFSKFLQHWGLSATPAKVESEAEKQKRVADVVDFAKLVRENDTKAGKRK